MYMYIAFAYEWHCNKQVCTADTMPAATSPAACGDGLEAHSLVHNVHARPVHDVSVQSLMDHLVGSAIMIPSPCIIMVALVALSGSGSAGNGMVALVLIPAESGHVVSTCVVRQPCAPYGCFHLILGLARSLMSSGTEQRRRF